MAGYVDDATFVPIVLSKGKFTFHEIDFWSPYRFRSLVGLLLLLLLVVLLSFGLMGSMVLPEEPSWPSLVFWILTFVFLFAKLKEGLLQYAGIGLPLAIYGCIWWCELRAVDVFLSAFGIAHDIYLGIASAPSLSFNLLLFWPGPLFPLSLLVLGINLSRKKAIPPMDRDINLFGCAYFSRK